MSQFVVNLFFDTIHLSSCTCDSCKLDLVINPKDVFTFNSGVDASHFAEKWLARKLALPGGFKKNHDKPISSMGLSILKERRSYVWKPDQKAVIAYPMSCQMCVNDYKNDLRFGSARPALIHGELMTNMSSPMQEIDSDEFFDDEEEEWEADYASILDQQMDNALKAAGLFDEGVKIEPKDVPKRFEELARFRPRQ